MVKVLTQIENKQPFMSMHLHVPKYMKPKTFKIERRNRKFSLSLKHVSSFTSVAQSCPTLCNPMDCSTPGFPVHHQFPELAQIHAHQVSDASIAGNNL